MIAETKTGFFRKNEVDMRYEHTVKGRFLERPNRFIAYVEVNGQRVICHVKNTGRCRELLTSGCTVVLEFHPHAREMGRKTEFDLIAVYKGNLLINMGFPGAQPGCPGMDGEPLPKGAKRQRAPDAPAL